MTYKEILISFRKILENCLELSSIYEKVATSTGTGSDGQPVISYVDNAAKKAINSWILEMDDISESIFNSLNSLFIDPDDEYQTQDMNYIIINGYADGSRSLEYYDKETQEFIEKPEYWYTRGNIYDMLPKANEGLYIYRYLDNVRNVQKTCNDYEELYTKYPEPAPPSPGSQQVPVTKADAFWDEYFSEFREKLTELLSPLVKEKNKFKELIQFTRTYKSVYEEVSDWISKGDTFVSALQKTSTGAGTCLADSFSSIGSSGFDIYSDSLGFVYSIFIEAKKERDSSKYANDDDSNMYLRKIFTSSILVKFDYYNKAKSCLEWILSFREHYDV